MATVNTSVADADPASRKDAEEVSHSVEAKIEESFRKHPWFGVISVEEAIADARRYRAYLSTDERQIYDEQILSGRHPTAVMEMIEIASGRLKPQGRG